MAYSSPQFSNSPEIIGLAPPAPRQRQDKVSKYAKYDDILGSSKHLTMKKKKNRVETFERSTIHSMEELLHILTAKKNLNNLSFHIRATIPFSSFNLPFHPTPEAVDALYDKIREDIYDGCGIALVLNHTDRAKDNVTRSKRYICRQDSRGDVSKSGKGSNLKQFHCGSRFIFKYKDRYAFVELDLIHRINHNVNIPVPTLTKAGFSKKDNIVDTTTVHNMKIDNTSVPAVATTAPLYTINTIPNNVTTMSANSVMTGVGQSIGYQPAITYQYPTSIMPPIYYQQSANTAVPNIQNYNPQTAFSNNDPYFQSKYSSNNNNNNNNNNSLPSIHADFQHQHQQLQLHQQQDVPILSQIPQYRKIRTPPQPASAAVMPFQLLQTPILPSVTNFNNGTVQYTPQTAVPMELAPNVAPTTNQPRLLPSFDEGFNRPAVLRGSISMGVGDSLDSQQSTKVDSDQDNIDRLRNAVDAFQTLKGEDGQFRNAEVSYYQHFVNEIRESLLNIGDGDPNKIKSVLSNSPFWKSIEDIENIVRKYSGTSVKTFNQEPISPIVPSSDSEKEPNASSQNPPFYRQPKMDYFDKRLQ